MPQEDLGGLVGLRKPTHIVTRVRKASSRTKSSKLMRLTVKLVMVLECDK